MIKNIIFDLGGVLVDFDPDRSLRVHFAPEYREAVKREVFLSREWALLDKGDLSMDEAVNSMCSRLPDFLREEIVKIVTEHETEMPPLPEMYPIVQKLKENGYRLYLLSNCPDWFDAYSPSVPALRFFDGFIISALYNQIKPRPEIYQTLFLRFDLSPEECFFIDDSQANVKAGIESGMSAYCFADKNIEELKSALREKGVKI